MEPKLIIFTNESGIRTVCGCLEKSDPTPEFFKVFQSNEKVFVLENDKLNIAKSLNDGDIFLVKDNIDQELYKTFLDQNYLDKIYILKHRKPRDGEFDFYTMNIEKGIHEQRPDGKYYPDVFDILQGNGSDKKERIFNKVFINYDKVLETKLELLHNCLSPMPYGDKFKIKPPENFDEIGEKVQITDKSVVEKCGKEPTVKEYLEYIPCGDPFDDSYIEWLTILRDELLKDY